MYEIKNLTFRYGLENADSLKQVSLHIKKGTMTVVIGTSGSGKTTFLRHLKKELLPNGMREGVIAYDGIPIEQLSSRRSVTEIGYLFQDPSHQMVMDTVWHEIAFGLENIGMPYGQMKRTVAEIVNYFDLQEIYNAPTQELSGGQKQMVNLAAITAMHPKVLVLDEPTAQLDPVSRKNFLSMIQKLQEEFQMTVIMAVHNLEDVMEMADACIFLKGGQVQMHGTPMEVAEYLKREKEPMKEALPQTTRLAEIFHLAPTFSMADIREKIGNCSYEVISKTAHRSSAILSISHLYAGYGKNQVLKNLSMEIKNQEFFAVVGANGSGKSTLLKCTADQMKYEGKIKSKKKIVYLPQDPTVLFLKDTLLDDLKEAGCAKEEELYRLINLCGLSNQLSTHPYDLSGGQRQMAALIKVLLAQPEVLLLDEPTKGMDRIHVRAFGKLLRRFIKEGMTVFCVSHDLEFCAEFADRVGMMFDGNIEGTDVPEKFFVDNYFFTTQTAKITRDMDNPVILPEYVRCL